MTTGFRWFRSALAAALVPLLAIGCSKTETETVDAPRVIVSGESFAIVTSKTTQLTATTVGGGDTTYTWSSSAPAVASVSETGLVTGLTPGSATITATGTSSNLSGSYNVVVANEIPQVAAWTGSGHARADSEAFRHWDHEGSVSTSCARCHSSGGYRDYLGDDGSTAFKVDVAAAPDTGIGCQACHNATAQTLSQVTFPSSVKLTGLGPEARCMTCHQGREATDTVNKALKDAKVDASVDADTVSTALSFKNVHYSAAGATLNAGLVRAGYEYAGKKYDWRFRHVPGYDTCVGCHDPHSLKVKVSGCDDCHLGVTADTLHDIREKASLAHDYDGDGDKTEGIAGEIETLRAALYSAMQGYVAAKGTDALCYNAHAHPYFLKDTDADGDCEEESTKYPAWTARLLRASFNYQFSLKDAGAFAHNGKYVIELLFDSIEDLSAGIVASGGTAIDMSLMVREDSGHFNGASPAARYASFTGASCTKCHTGSEGFGFFTSFGVTKAVTEQGNGLDCMTCHTALPASVGSPNLVAIAQVTFPSGKVIKASAPGAARESSIDAKSLLCMTCHSGREAKSTLDAAITAAGVVDPDTVSTALSFKNVHYLPAGATLLGKEAAVGYEYTGKTYAGRDTHPLGINCNDCHGAYNSKHTFRVEDNFGACYGCHGIPQPTSVDDFRGSIFATNDFDYDGDADIDEPLVDELDGLSHLVLVAIQDAADAHPAADAICYDSARHPYWFKDTDGDGTCQITETTGYGTWTPKLLKAAFNYQLSHKEPGAWAHNMTYVSQLLFDSLVDLGVDTNALNLTRP